MGLRYRKSAKIGGMRINFSKSGIGYSFGVPGYRVTKKAGGGYRTTASIPSTGVSYVKDYTSKPSNDQQHTHLTADGVQMHEIDSIKTENLQNSPEYHDLLEKMRKCANRPRIFSSFSRVKTTYEFSDGTDEVFDMFTKAWLSLRRADKLWEIVQAGDIQNRRVHAGASRLLNRQLCDISQTAAPFISSNVSPICLKLVKETVYFYPDVAVIHEKPMLGAINLLELQFEVAPTRFIEESAVPQDTTVVGKTWAKVNADGSPDKRFKNNRQLQICQYGRIQITSPDGFNITLHCSSLERAKEFVESMILVQNKLKAIREQQ